MSEAKSKIIVLSEQLRGQSFELTGEKYSVGRNTDCDITLPDPTISSHHCSFIRDTEGGDGYTVVDEGSTNGTRVNGTRVTESHKLSNSDIVQVGAIELLFDSQESGSQESAKTKTGIELDKTAGTSTITETPNFSPFAQKKNKNDKNKLFQLILKSLIGGLVIALTVVIGVIIYRLLTS